MKVTLNREPSCFEDNSEWRYGIVIVDLPNRKENLSKLISTLQDVEAFIPEHQTEFGHLIQIKTEMDSEYLIIKLFSYVTAQEKEILSVLESVGITELPAMTVSEQELFLSNKIIKSEILKRLSIPSGGWSAGKNKNISRFDLLVKDKGYVIE